MSYIIVDGKSYFSPCEECKDQSCYSCILRKYQDDLKEEKEKRGSAEFRIETELEPRIKAEKQSYDFYMLTDRSNVKK